LKQHRIHWIRSRCEQGHEAHGETIHGAMTIIAEVDVEDWNWKMS
jgi:hypothetical protein